MKTNRLFPAALIAALSCVILAPSAATAPDPDAIVKSLDKAHVTQKGPVFPNAPAP